MANIFTSSIGKKLIMSITGAFLILFLTFHMIMNGALVFSDDAYNAIVNFLGANWYALVGTVILAAGVVFHFVYAIVLTVGNLRARGKVRYAETKRENGVEWSSKNMFVLGLVVLGGLLLPLFNCWYNMQWTEIIGRHVNSLGFGPKEGAEMVRFVFSHVGYVIAYIVWLVALWFHLTHGMWSMMQTVGWNSKVWMKRLKCIAYILSTLIVGCFMLIVIILYVQSLM